MILYLPKYLIIRYMYNSEQYQTGKEKNARPLILNSVKSVHPVLIFNQCDGIEIVVVFWSDGVKC